MFLIEAIAVILCSTPGRDPFVDNEKRSQQKVFEMAASVDDEDAEGILKAH
jgi:hypothetical protein